MKSTSTKPVPMFRRFLDSDFFYYFKRDKVAVVSTIIFLSLVFMAVFSPLIAPYDPYNLQILDIMDSELPPIWEPGADQDSERLLPSLAVDPCNIGVSRR